ALPRQAARPWALRLATGLGVLLALGGALVGLAARWGGYRPAAAEALALAWLLGAGLGSVLLLWLDWAGVSPAGGRLTLAATAGAGLIATLWLAWRGRKGPSEPGGGQFRPNAGPAPQAPATWGRPATWLVRLALAGLLAWLLLYVLSLALGHPLTGWDSWVNWAAKARTIFASGGITPAIYADPSRAVMLLDYPLALPLLQAWLFGWLGAADERLLGTLTAAAYLALPALVYAAARRWGASRTLALAAGVAAAAIGSVADMAAFVLPEAMSAGLMAAAAIYLFDWVRGAPAFSLLVGAAAAGLLPWFKREGLLLAAVLSVSLVAAAAWSPGRRPALKRCLLALLALALAGGLLAGPWWLFAGRQAIPNAAFEAPSLAGLAANLERLPLVAWLMLRSLLSRSFNLIWPLAAASLALVAAWRWRGRAASGFAAFQLVAMGFLGLMSLGYLFSAYVPLQQHVLASAYRLAAQVAPLVILGWAGQAARGRPT
ncbi:MAG: hypothetical protein ACRDHL_08770, partial [Candidatus Promineifilaceae bacterium]